MDDLAHRRRRLRRAHHLVRSELAIAVAVSSFAAFLLVAMPTASGPMRSGESPFIESLVPWVGFGLFIVGLVWMIRLSRPDPDPGERSWRYRDFD